MATNTHTQGLMPAVNDLAAGLAILLAYVTRFGVISEGGIGWWHVPLVLATDLVLPVLGGVWLLGVPVWQCYQRIEKGE